MIPVIEFQGRRIALLLNLDVPNTARYQAYTVFELLKCDEVITTPYLGPDSIKTLMEYGKPVYVVVMGCILDGLVGVDGRPLWMGMYEDLLEVLVGADDETLESSILAMQ